MVLIERDPHKSAACEFDERTVIGRHTWRRDDVQLGTDGGEDVGFERALDDHNPGVAREIGETELEMERAARAGSVRQIGRGEPEVSQPLLRREWQSHLAGLNAPRAVGYGNEQPRQEIVFRLPEMDASAVLPTSRNAAQRTGD